LKIAHQNRQPRRHATTGLSFYFSQDFPPIYFAQQTLESIHSFTHLPWWGIILGLTLFLRTIITLPLAVRQNKLVAKIELLQPTLNMMSEALKHRVTVDCKRAGKTAAQFEAIYKKKVILLNKPGNNSLLLLFFISLVMTVCYTLYLTVEKKARKIFTV
jgi:membrane protein insertase Oxa1/YidC/SpoIIIJ